MEAVSFSEGNEVSVGVAVALGRIEANLDSLTSLTKENAVQMKEIDTRLRAVETAVAQKPDDDRFRKLEATVETLKATQPVKIGWWTIAAGLAAIAGVVSTVFIVFNFEIVTN